MQSPLAQWLVQQLESEAQALPNALHCVGETQLPSQAPLQHSVGTLQTSPSCFKPHELLAPHVPPELQTPPQHSPPTVQ